MRHLHAELRFESVLDRQGKEARIFDKQNVPILILARYQWLAARFAKGHVSHIP
jgi:hypothetical protein